MTNLATFRWFFLEKRFCNFQKIPTTCHRFNHTNEENPTSKRTSKEEQTKYLQNHSFTCIDEIKEPTTCCMSGCANCVWLEYAETISKFLKENEEDVQKIISERVKDPNMRAFLEMELRCRNLLKKV